MAVLVLGGYGLIGAAIVDRLVEDGFAVIGLGRRIEAARRRRPDVGWRQADIATLRTPQDWARLLEGVDAVVNAAGALQSGLRDDLAAVQHLAIAALAQAARRAGVRRFVQISGAGAEAWPDEPFFATKAAADRAVRDSGLDWVILRPGVVVSPVAYGGTALLRGLAAFPWVTPLAYRQSPTRFIGVGDVASAVSAALRGEIPSGSALDLVEAHSRSLAESVTLFRAWLGLPPAPLAPAPAPIVALVAGVADLLGWLGWRSPLRSTALRVMAKGVDGDPAPAIEILGREFDSLPQVLARTPASVQELWFARLWLLKPVVIGALAVFWLASGAIGLWREDAAVQLLTSRGVPEALSRLTVLGGSMLDMTLGALALFRPLTGAALKGMALAALAYMAGSLAFAPDLWLDPLGPMVKVLPALILSLVGLAVLEER